MTAKITSRDEYDASPAEVFAMVQDESFQLAKYDAVGMTNGKVLEAKPRDDGGFLLRTQRDVETAGIPDFAKKFLGERQTIVETDEWSPAAADGSRSGTWKVEAKGAPMQMSGRFTMSPAGSGTTVLIEGEVKASIPLVGGKIEKAVAEATEKTLREECEFGQRWLADH